MLDFDSNRAFSAADEPEDRVTECHASNCTMHRRETSPRGIRKKSCRQTRGIGKKNNEIQEVQKQLQTQARQLNDESRAALTKSIETKTTELQRAQDDARKEFGAMQNEIFSRIGNRVGSLVQQYAKENNFSLIVDTSQNSQVIYFDPTIDITAEIIKRADAGQASAPATKPATTPTPPATKP